MKSYDIGFWLVVPANCNFAAKAPEYVIDNSANVGSFKQAACLLELQKAGGNVEYAFVAMDAFTDDIRRIAVPTVASGARFMQQVGNLTVRSNVDGIQAVADFDSGNIEFWPGNSAADELGAHKLLCRETALRFDTIFADSTCVKSSIHFPVDWVLLRLFRRLEGSARLFLRRLKWIYRVILSGENWAFRYEGGQLVFDL